MSISLTYNIDENTCARYIVIPSISSTSNSSNAFNMTLRFIAINRTAFQTLSLFGTSLFASYRCPHPPPAKPPHPPPRTPPPLYINAKNPKKSAHIPAFRMENRSENRSPAWSPPIFFKSTVFLKMVGDNDLSGLFGTEVGGLGRVFDL